MFCGVQLLNEGRKKEVRPSMANRYRVYNRGIGCRGNVQLLFFSRNGSWSVELRKHLLPELFTSGFGSMSILHLLAGENFRFTRESGVQRQPGVQYSLTTSKR